MVKDPYDLYKKAEKEDISYKDENKSPKGPEIDIQGFSDGINVETFKGYQDNEII